MCWFGIEGYEIELSIYIYICVCVWECVGVCGCVCSRKVGWGITLKLGESGFRFPIGSFHPLPEMSIMNIC
jgi:hypothetical protein